MQVPRQQRSAAEAREEEKTQQHRAAAPRHARDMHASRDDARPSARGHRTEQGGRAPRKKKKEKERRDQDATEKKEKKENKEDRRRRRAETEGAWRGMEGGVRSGAGWRGSEGARSRGSHGGPSRVQGDTWLHTAQQDPTVTYTWLGKPTGA
eukprot:3296228-Rhodomonas_salina.2